MVDLSKYKGSAPEIAQFALDDRVFDRLSLHFTLVKNKGLEILDDLKNDLTIIPMWPIGCMGHPMFHSFESAEGVSMRALMGDEHELNLWFDIQGFLCESSPA